MNPIQFAVNLAVAFGFGSLIGAERQWRLRMAGLRTNALVASGAAMFVMLGMPASDPQHAHHCTSCFGHRLPRCWCDHARGPDRPRPQYCCHTLVLGGVGTLSGSGQIHLASLGTFRVLLANFRLRPLARLIDRQPTRPAMQRLTLSICSVWYAAVKAKPCARAADANDADAAHSVTVATP